MTKTESGGEKERQKTNPWGILVLGGGPPCDEIVGPGVVKQLRTVGRVGFGRGAVGLSALIGFGSMSVACGGRTLDGDGLAGNAGDGQGGATNLTSTGNNGNGNNGNGNNGNGNNGNATTMSGGPSNETSMSVVTSTHGTTAGSMPSGTCDDPYILDASMASFSGVTEGASAFAGSCNGAGPEVFFSWAAPRSGSYRMHTSGSAIDTVLYRLNRLACDARVVDCNDDVDANGTAELLFFAERGERMGFVLDSYYAAGAFQLAIDGTDMPPCGGAFAELSGVGQLLHQQLPLDDTTLGDSTLDACEGWAPRIKVDWTAPRDGRFVFDTVGSNYDTVLVLRTICEGPAGEACNDDEFGLQSGLVATVSEGQVLRVEIAAFSGNYVPEQGDVPVVALNVREE